MTSLRTLSKFHQIGCHKVFPFFSIFCRKQLVKIKQKKKCDVKILEMLNNCVPVIINKYRYHFDTCRGGLNQLAH